MKNFIKRFILSALTVTMCASVFSVSAMATNNQPGAVDKNGTITFYNLDALEENESITHKFTDQNGNPITISIRRALLPVTKASNSTTTWEIIMDTPFVDAEYYIDVTNNVIQSNVHGIAIVKRHFPKESLKHCPTVAHPLLPVGLHHAELVGIGVQSKAIIWIIKFHCSIFPSIWLTKR